MIVFAAARSNVGGVTRVTVWGTYDANEFEFFMQQTPLLKDKKYTKTYQVDYVEKAVAEFESDLLNALAAGRGPDLFLLPQADILKHKDKAYLIPYPSLPQRDFRDTFVGAAEVFMLPEGIIGIPFSIDPLMLFWNRDYFSSKGLAEPPKYWDELEGLAEVLTEKDDRDTIFRSAIALGEAENVLNSEEILSALLHQAGNSIVVRSEFGYRSTLTERLGFTLAPIDSVIRFYTEFSDPTKSTYTWNRSLPSSKDMFLSGDLAMYIGFASEFGDIREKNPNLNFDAVEIPQAKNAKTRATFARVSSFAISKHTKNPRAAFDVALVLAGPESQAAFSTRFKYPPVRRDLLSKRPADPFEVSFYNSAIMSHTWLDPDDAETDRIFSTLIESVNTGRDSAQRATLRADDELGILVGKVNKSLESSGPAAPII